LFDKVNILLFAVSCLLNSRFSGISPVIATVILIAIAVTVSLAVAFWAAGLTGSFTRFERVHSLNAYVVVGYRISGTSSIKYYNVTFLWENLGSADTTIVDIHLNGKSLKSFWPSAEVYLDKDPTPWVSGHDTSFKEIPFPSGSKLNFVIVFPSDPVLGSPFASGQTIEVEAVTSHGVFYVTLFNIP